MTGIDITLLKPNAAASGIRTLDVVCANCLKPLTDFAMFGPQSDQGGRRIRGYLGHCLRCAHDSEVLQFFGGDGRRWPMAGYRLNRGPWVEVQPLPAAPLVMTGPGGDFQHAYTPPQTSDLRPALLQVEGIVTHLLNAIRELIKIDGQSNG